MPSAGHVSVKNITSVGTGSCVREESNTNNKCGHWAVSAKHVDVPTIMYLCSRARPHSLSASPFSGWMFPPLCMYAALETGWGKKTPLEGSEKALSVNLGVKWSVSLSTVAGSVTV